MTTDERRKRILELLDERKAVSVTELAATFSVVPMTIRRDLDHLEQQGVLARSHGVAVATGEPFLTRPLKAKEAINRDAKALIGKAAVNLINEGEIIILDEGSTCIEVAKALRDHGGFGNLTVVTNGLKIAMELEPVTYITTIMVGGVCGHGNYAVHGPDTVEAFSHIRAHKYFMGIDALVPGYGVSDADPYQVQLKRVKAASALEVIGVADNTKLGKIGVARVGPSSLMDKLIMNLPVPDSLHANLAEEGVELIGVGE